MVDEQLARIPRDPVAAPDQDARERIRTDLETTLFVEAGAGSGKTTALVNRVLALVGTGVPLGAIAAITFTEKAGSELRDRLRRALEGGVVDHRYREALDSLDGAAIGTLHSFSQRLLSENPVEARLPPSVEVLDEVTSGLEFERRWETFRDELLADPELERTILLFLSAGPREDALRVLAMAFDDNWDLVAERVPAESPEPPHITELIAPALAELRAACATAVDCALDSDTMVKRLAEIADLVVDLESGPTEYDVMERLGGGPSFKVGTCGNQRNWPDLTALRSRVAAAGVQLAIARAAVASACAHRLGSAIRAFTLAAAVERQASGRLEFHDLLVLARTLVADPEVCARLHIRYRYLLLDEFQDTDPIQVELAVRIAAVSPSPSLPWTSVELRPGHLFVVGDPKQSIYRFRRADIATFLRAKRRFGEERGATVELTTNFRTVAPIIAWVNATFGELMKDKGSLDAPLQPDYVALDAVRPDPPGGPAVAVVGSEAHDAKATAADLRRAEAVSVAATVAQAIEERWEVHDGTWRPARLGDVTILVPARTSLPFLEDALAAAGIPFRAETSSLVYATRAVRDLLMVLRAVDDPTDSLRLVAALRTPLLGCGDDDLFRFRVERRGSWSFQAPQPPSVPEDDPVASGLAYLRTLSDDRRWVAPSQLMMRVAQERRAYELGFAEGRPRDVWRRLRFVIDQARGWSEVTGGSLREYLHWVDQQTSEGSRVSEAVLPETDDDAVRIMTIHAAKGLEFPITIVSGLSTVPGGRSATARVTFPPGGDVGYSFGKGVQTPEFEAWTPIDEQMGFHERVRLLYVACTRARDHLVVSVHRRQRTSPAGLPALTSAELLVEGIDLSTMAETGDRPVEATEVVTAPADPIPDFGTWRAERDGWVARAGRPGTVAATALTDDGTPDTGLDPAVVSGPAPTVVDPGLEKRPRDLDLPPWLKGRYGTAVGRAVHGVLQTIDLATGAGSMALVAAQCEAEAIPERAADVERLVRSALASRSVIEAARSQHWREVYACTPVGDRLLEGYIDLLYRSDAGLVVVDHKTAATADRVEIDRRLARYRTQGASYALVVAASTGEKVARVTFLFLTPDGAVERDLPRLDQAVEAIRILIVTGRETEAD